MLGCSYVGDGNGYTTGNVSHVTGQSGSFAAGMGFDFPYQQPCDNYIDQIGSNGGTLLFMSQDNYGRIICYGGPSDSYRSIHATCVFGALHNGVSTKDQLMIQYMDYLTQTIGVEEMQGAMVASMSLAPNPAHRDVSVKFTLNKGANVSLKVYNVAGQSVRVLSDGHMPAGSHAVMWDRNDESGRAVSSGTYIVTIQVNGTANSKTAVLID